MIGDSTLFDIAGAVTGDITVNPVTLTSSTFNTGSGFIFSSTAQNVICETWTLTGVTIGNTAEYTLVNLDSGAAVATKF